jgi:hypothetical protein
MKTILRKQKLRNPTALLSFSNVNEGKKNVNKCKKLKNK